MGHQGSCQTCLILVATVRLPGPPERFEHDTNPQIELSIAPHLNSKLVPPHARAALAARGLDIDNFTPLTKDEMMARLD